MAKGIVTNAAGRTTDFMYEVGKTRTASATESLVVLSARITEGPHKGERATLKLFGTFDLEAGDGTVTEWRESVGGKLHFKLLLDRPVPVQEMFDGDLGEPLQLIGNRFDNLLEGDRTANRLVGNAGDDRLAGMRGADDLVGGTGADRFFFLETADSTSARHDTIRDFGQGDDLIHLRAVDADSEQDGNQRFDFIGSDGFSGAAGELRIGGGGSLVLGDTDGDRTADLVIRLAGAPEVGPDDFIL